jgi:microcystin-dependent protein
MIFKSSVTKLGCSKSVALLTLVAGIVAYSIASTDASACSADSEYIGSICVVPYGRGCPTGYVPADGRLLPLNTYQALFSLIGVTFGGDGRTNFAVPDLRGREPVGVGPATQASGTKSATSAVALGQYRGQESVTLNANNVPVHTHAATFTPTTGAVPVTIPAQAASGSITARATTDIVPGNPSTTRPAANVPNYYLTGVSGTISGPVTTTIPGADKSTLIGTTVIVDSSTYKAATASQTVNINTVTGGNVTVYPTSSQGLPTATLPPQLGLYYCIATTGIYPMFDN